MKPTKEHFLRLAEEVGLINENNRDLLTDRIVCSQIVALCQRVWDEAMEEAANKADESYADTETIEAILALKGKK